MLINAYQTLKILVNPKTIIFKNLASLIFKKKELKNLQNVKTLHIKSLNYLSNSPSKMSDI